MARSCRSSSLCSWRSATRQGLAELGAPQQRAHGVDDGVGQDFVVVLDLVRSAEARRLAGGESLPDRVAVAVHHGQLHLDLRVVGRGFLGKELPDLALDRYGGVAVDDLEPRPIEQVADMAADEGTHVVGGGDRLRLITLEVLPNLLLVISD